MKPTLTHVALSVRSIDDSVAFYERFAGLHVVHARVEGTRVVWLGEYTDHPTFVFVLIEGAAPDSAAPTTLLHFGFAFDSRDEVDAVAERAREAGVLEAAPVWGGPVVGYFCMLRDPDGHFVEFSHGQSIGRHDE